MSVQKIAELCSQAKARAGEASASQALDARLQAIEQQLTGLAGQGVGRRVSDSESRTAQVWGKHCS